MFTAMLAVLRVVFHFGKWISRCSQRATVRVLLWQLAWRQVFRIYRPSKNLGCLGVRIGNILYVDMFADLFGTKGVFWRVPKSRNWLFVGSRWPYLKYKHDPMVE